MENGSQFKKRHTSPKTEFKKGHNVPDVWRKKWSEKRKGQLLSQETKIKISKSLKGH